MPSFEQDHLFLLELSNILEPKKNNTRSTSDSPRLANSLASMHEEINGPTPVEKTISTPQNWYTQYWFNCTINNLCADLDRYEFREICDYTFEDDETIYTGHFLDLYRTN